MKLGKKKGVTEVSKRDREKRAKLNKILVGFVMAVVLFVGLVTIEEAIIKNEIKLPTVVATKEIAARTVIKATDLSNNFKVIDVPEQYRAQDALSSLDELGDIITTQDMTPNAVLTAAYYTAEDDLLNQIEDPIEISINLGQVETAVAGKVRAGDIINISKVTSSESESGKVTYHSTYIMENAYVVEAHTGTPTVSRDDVDTTVTLITVYVPRAKEADIYKALEEGTLRVGLVKNADDTEYKINDDAITTNVTSSSSLTPDTTEETVDTVTTPEESTVVDQIVDSATDAFEEATEQETVGSNN